jgi:hypothetical protein
MTLNFWISLVFAVILFVISYNLVNLLSDLQMLTLEVGNEVTAKNQNPAVEKASVR